MPSIIKIGRADDNTIRLGNLYIGNHHAEIYIHSFGEMYLKDLNSKNGTRINGIKIAPNIPIRIQFGDNITFAKTPLNWQLIPIYDKTQITTPNQETSGEVANKPIAVQEKETGSFSEFIGEVTGSKDRFRSIKTFFYLLENTSERLVSMASSKDRHHFDPFEFFTVGLGLYLFNATYFLINLSEDITEQIVEVPEWLVSLFLAIGIFILGWINFNLFKLLTETKKTLSDYLILWFGFTGFLFIGFSFITFPFVVILFFDKPIWHNSNQVILKICIIINIFYCLVWLPVIWIKMNKKFWDTTYFRVIFIFLSIIGISWLALRFISSYLN